MKALLWLAWVSMLGAQGWTQQEVDRSLAPYAYVLLVDRGDATTRWSRDLKATEAFQPCSTFKLAHALVALEAGVVSLEASAKRCDPSECHSDHGVIDLPGAIRESCVSYFRQTARALGPARMAQGLARLGYPATGTLEPIAGFWLTGGMRITAEQQLAWARRFYSAPLPVQAEALAAVRAATRLAPGDGFLLQGKTGSSRRGFGWFIGEVSQQGRPTWVVVLLKGSGATGREAERRLRLLLGKPS